MYITADLKCGGLPWTNNQLSSKLQNNNSPSSQIHLTTESVLKKHEQEKKRNYNKRIMEIEHSIFTPSAFSVSGGMGKRSVQ